MPGPPLLSMHAIRKAFGPIQILRGVDFEVRAGEVHALVGENGAGKSTLIKILAGVHTDYAGEVRLNGRPVRFPTPRAAEDHGIAVIHQELALVPHMSIAENVLLGRLPRTRFGRVNRRRLRADAAAVLRDQLGIELDVARPVADLPIAVQQLVEIAKALARDAAVLVMDEPTSALPEADARRLFDMIQRLRSRGVGVVYISHKMEEIYALADRISVLRDGELIGTATPGDLPPDRLVQWMVGRQVSQHSQRQPVPPGELLLEVGGLWIADPAGERWLIQDAALTVRAGEIVGLAGLLGSGASELLGALYGRFSPHLLRDRHNRPARGVVHVLGRSFDRPRPSAALARGMALLTADRKASGLVLPLSVLHNLSLATLHRCTNVGLLSRGRERMRVFPVAERLKLRTPGMHAAVEVLSGGNQQKVLLARWLLTGPRVLLLDEPTRGIDVAAKADIYALLASLTASGVGILLITSELPELLSLSDRILVLHRGQIVQEFARECATQEVVLGAAMGKSPRTSAADAPS